MGINSDMILGVHNAFGLGVVTDNFTTVSVTNLSAARDPDIPGQAVKGWLAYAKVSARLGHHATLRYV